MYSDSSVFMKYIFYIILSQWLHHHILITPLHWSKTRIRQQTKVEIRCIQASSHILKGNTYFNNCLLIIINILKHKPKLGFKHIYRMIIINSKTPFYSFQHLGMGSLQRLETLRALGELTKRRRLGFLMYPHRHGFCSFSFAQHNADGGEDDVIACAHGLSCIGEHVTASAAGTMITRRTAAMAKRDTHVALIITIFLLLLLFSLSL